MILTPAFGAQSGTGNEARIRQPLVGDINGVNVEFSVSGIIDRSDAEKLELVLLNGATVREGASEDYVVSESGGAGSGYDTITMKVPPRDGDWLEILYIPKII